MSFSEFAESILLSTSLDDKLAASEAMICNWGVGGSVDQKQQKLGDYICPEYPGRPKELDFAQHKGRRVAFPTREQILGGSDTCRGQALHFFANHELLAMELMALVLLKFPEADPEFRSGIVRTIKEEQRHLSMYRQRMEELGVGFGDIPVNSFFWDTLKNISSPLDYTIKMSLTFEQANLDFSRYYRDLFRSMGDQSTAEILDVVYQEEISHVAYGLSWFKRLKETTISDWEFFQNSLELPLSPSRAKGQIFDEDARRKAGLSEEFITSLKIYSQSKGRPPVVRYLNLSSEEEWGRFDKGFVLPQATLQLEKDYASLMLFLSTPGDVVLVEELPSSEFLMSLQDSGFALPQLLVWNQSEKRLPPELLKRQIKKIEPWAQTPSSLAVEAEIEQANIWKSPTMSKIRGLFANRRRATSKEFSTVLGQSDDFQQVRNRRIVGGAETSGRICRSLAEVRLAIDELSVFTGKVGIKSPFGSSGRNMIRSRNYTSLETPYKNWIANQLRSNKVLIVEPWLDKRVDLSVIFSVDACGQTSVSGITRFFTTANGQYLGHILGNRSGWVPPDILESIGRLSTLNSADNGKISACASESLYDVLKEIAMTAGDSLAKTGFVGSAGVDCFLYHYLNKDVEGLSRLEAGQARQAESLLQKDSNLVQSRPLISANRDSEIEITPRNAESVERPVISLAYYFSQFLPLSFSSSDSKPSFEGIRTEGAGHYFLKPVVEINTRHTMGHVAQRIGKRVASGANAVWIHVGRRDIKSMGFRDFREFAEACTDEYPLVRTHDVVPRIVSGVICTTDPNIAKHVMSVLFVAEKS